MKVSYIFKNIKNYSYLNILLVLIITHIISVIIIKLKKEIGKVIDWSKVDKEEYLLAMERSPIKDTEIKLLLQSALTDKINDRTVYMKGIDVSYQYEGYNTYSMEELDNN